MDLNLYVKRFQFSLNSTIGRLFVENDYECFTLEDTDRQVDGVPVAKWKQYGKTCIPRGTYEIKMLWSNHYKCLMPHIIGVEGFSEIMIHIGNGPLDTLGCLLVGRNAPRPDFIIGSKVAYYALLAKLKKAFEAKQRVFITFSGQRNG